MKVFPKHLPKVSQFKRLNDGARRELRKIGERGDVAGIHGVVRGAGLNFKNSTVKVSYGSSFMLLLRSMYIL